MVDIVTASERSRPRNGVTHKAFQQREMLSPPVCSFSHESWLGAALTRYDYDSGLPPIYDFAYH